jgi:DNA-binding MurR/RpiR family transcriptional regulator
MENTTKLNEEILRLTNELKEQKPTVYKHLLENPKTIPNNSGESLAEALKTYRNHLMTLINKKQEK